MTERKIGQDFIDDLIKEDGKLHFFLKKVRDENEKCTLEVRANYINIYYEGGSLLRIEEKAPHNYDFQFDKKYCKRKNGNIIINRHGEPIKTKRKSGDVDALWSSFAEKYYYEMDNWHEKEYEEHFENLKKEMDGWFMEHPKNERRYQHYASIVNNNAIDVEYAIAEKNLRLDMVMINNGELYLIENKFGNGSLSSVSSKTEKEYPGLSKHYKDFMTIIENDELMSNLKDSLDGIISAKYSLGLLPENYVLKEKNGRPVVHVLFALADYDRTKGNKVIAREYDVIKENRKESLKDYEPLVLITNKDEYKLNLNEARLLREIVSKKD